MLARSWRRPGPVGFQLSLWRVQSLAAGMSRLAKWASQPKWVAASSGLMDLTGISSKF